MHYYRVTVGQAEPNYHRFSDWLQSNHTGTSARPKNKKVHEKYGPIFFLQSTSDNIYLK